MARLLITTVGTSLLTNRDDRPWSGWDGRKRDPLPDEKSIQQWLAFANLVSASAETNTLQALSVGDCDHIVFLHSDTQEGRFCSHQLCSFYKSKCVSVAERQIDALGYEHESFSQRGLRSLVSVVIDEIKHAKAQGHSPTFCATGGFKAEIAFLNLLGALLNIEVFYIHEQFREVVRLPRLPLTWNVDQVVQHRNFFDWIDSEPRSSYDVESWLKNYPDLRSLVEDNNSYTYLNAAGDLLYRAAKERLEDRPRAKWPPGVPLPPSEKNGVSVVEHHRPKGWEQFVNRLCEIDCVRRVVYDEIGLGGSVVKVLNAKTGTLAVRYGSNDSILPLRVETTADSEDQIMLVVEYIRRRVR